jgi:stress response protein SCP2
MDTLPIRRLRVLPVPRGAGLPAKQRLGVLAELAGLGYAIPNPERLDAADPSWLDDYVTIVAALRALRGGDVDHVPLFLGFPNDVPDEDEYFVRRIVGYLGNIFGVFGGPSGSSPSAPKAFSAGETLENGIVVPAWLFDLRRFGADPITQLQSAAQLEAAKATMADRVPDGHVEWIELPLVWADEVPALERAWLCDVLYAKSSIKEELHEDVRVLLLRHGDAAGIDCDRISINETKALVLRAFWEAGRLDAVIALARTPTDLLRMMAALTDTDVSLATKARFPKLGRAQRRAVLTVLEKSPLLAEDLSRYRGLWLELGRYVHPGEHADRFPLTAAAFDRLRNATIPSFEGTTERLLAAHDLRGALAHLATRPGLLARRLHELLRRFPHGTKAILAAFAELAPKMTTKALLVLRAHMATIDDAPYRTVINKRGKLKVLPNNAHRALPRTLGPRVDAILHRALVGALAKKPSLAGARVWIDPALADYVVPLQQRAASDGLVTFGRGSRIPVELDKVLRLFVYWKQAKQRTDLDLSVISFDADFKYLGHVSYTRLSGEGIVHSGDIQSAPLGATELIDITLAALPKNVRYLAAQVYRFTGDAFADMVCHAGWMVRTHVDADAKAFDIATVANKLDLKGTGAYAIPMFVDLQAERIVVTDLFMGGKALHNTVEGALGNVAAACREISRFTTTRPTMATLARLHLEARGGRKAKTFQQADVSFGLAGCTYDAADVERVLSELL